MGLLPPRPHRGFRRPELPRETSARRSWAHLPRLLASSALLLLAACGASVDESRAGDGGEEPQVATSLTFVPGGVLRLASLEHAELSVAASPPGQYVVRFALLPDRPNAAPNDASLDRAETVTDARGVATITLIAPSTPSTFMVRAAIGDLETHLPVSVSDRGYARVIAEPVYHGSRAIEEWVASVRIGSSCGDLIGFPPPDGALVATSDADGSPKIDNVPVRAIASVSVRSGQFAYGCTNVTDLQTDETRRVRVEVADRPLQLGGTLDLTLRFGEQGGEWAALLESAMAAGLAAFRDGAATDAALLLDDMMAAISPPDGDEDAETLAGHFADNRAEFGFDDALAAHLLDADVDLRSRVQAWLEAGVQDLDPVKGKLELRSSSAVFRLVSAAGIPASESGFLGTATWSAFADPGDTLVLGGALRFDATRWVTALAEKPAQVQFEDAVDVPAALALTVGCEQVGALLAGLVAPDDPPEAEGELYPGCTAECGAALCEAALVSAWTRATDAGGELMRLSIALTGTALVDTDATPRELSGTWLGTLEGPSSVVGGPARAKRATAP